MKVERNQVMADFLLEIGLDEIPARMIAGAEAELGKRVSDLLTRERLLGANGNVTTYSTPRRLAVVVEDVLPSQADTEEKLTGPSWKVAFKDGAPTAAAEAFAKKAGVAVAALEKVTNAKGEYVGATVKRLGRTAGDLLAAELPKEVLALYWAKNMYWRSGKPERFVRPVRWVVALLDSEIVPVEIAGIAAGNVSRGHRVLHGHAPVIIDSPKSYVEAMRAAFVKLNVAERRHAIRKALDKVTRTVEGARWREDEALIETVVHLTEWPTVVMGGFEAEYLKLPEEVLVTVMRDHQKYFAVESADGKLAPHFLAVLNVEVDDEGRANIVRGNERVLRARFKDAQFFWDFDQKIPLVERVESLKNVTFQKELGSYYWKTEENLRVVKNLVNAMPGVNWEPPEWSALQTATQLAKADLTAELVKEFTELQGIIGGLYADAQGLGDKVRDAIYDQYRPASTDDRIPRTVEGQLLGLADRVQTVTAMFGINMAPTGSKDPFALRRAANGIIKILAESDIPLSLTSVLNKAATKDAKRSQLDDFFRERLQFYLKDVRGIAYDVVNAVLADCTVVSQTLDVRTAVALSGAMTQIRDSEDFRYICQSFKRIKNILRQAEEKGFALSSSQDVTLSAEAQQLSDAAAALAPEVAKLREQRNYSQALAAIATLRPVVDAFFDKVMVLDPDESVRGANLGLIASVLSGFSGIADFSEIVTA